MNGTMPKNAKTEEVLVRIVLVDPPPGIDYGVQRGNGSQYETVFTRRPRSPRGEVAFDVALTAKNDCKDGRPNIAGPFAQGAPADRFVYIDIGRYAGQTDTDCARRMKVPLGGISWTLIRKAAAANGTIETRIPGVGKDGGPTCASTAKVQSAWRVVDR